jgi:hypothetical protein
LGEDINLLVVSIEQMVCEDGRGQIELQQA